MGCCLIAIVGSICPRILLFFIWLLTNWFALAYETRIWPFLGFLLMPFTTLAYMAAIINNGRLDGIWLAIFVIAAIIDLGSNGSTVKERMK